MTSQSWRILTHYINTNNSTKIQNKSACTLFNFLSYLFFLIQISVACAVFWIDDKPFSFPNEQVEVDEYIPPHRAKLIKIPENGIQLPFNIITSKSKTLESPPPPPPPPPPQSHASSLSPPASDSLMTMTSQFRFPAKRTATTVTAPFHSPNSESITLPIQHKDTYKFPSLFC